MGEDEWTVDPPPGVDGRTVVVTGANSGIGFEATRAFAAGGARVVMACRSVERGEEAAAEAREADPPGELVVRELDLASLSSVRSFASGVDEPVGVLVNNAGVMAVPYGETEDGFETQYGVNHLGHFALTGLLLDRLRAVEGESRVVTVSSDMHKQGRPNPVVREGIDPDSYGRWTAFARSKLANLLFAFELQRRFEAAGEDVKSVGVHPGYADTDLQRRAPEMLGSRVWLYFMKVANLVMAQSAERGSWPILYGATHPDLSGGEYVGPTGIMEMRGSPGVVEPSKRARNEDLAGRLWDASEELTGVTYDLVAAPAG
ncbi:short-chain dehydrogenase [Halobacteriales archaeon QS_8_69_26]|nr:MAG: short-chain dehydrogenase [Halobacteriales archaeon QS_8_69_26]